MQGKQLLVGNEGCVAGSGSHWWQEPVYPQKAPSVLQIGVFAGAMNIAEWHEKGVVQLLRCAPISTSSTLGSALTVAFASAIVQTLSRFLPMTYLLEGVRWPFTGVVDFQHAARGWLVMAVTGSLLLAASTRLMRWR